MSESVISMNVDQIAIKFREDKNFMKRRKYKYRIDEYKIRKFYYPKLNIKKVYRLYYEENLFNNFVAYNDGCSIEFNRLRW